MLRVEVDDGERLPLGGDAARGHGRGRAADLQLAEDGGVEGGRDARRAGQVLGTLARAVVHVVALGRDDPVAPLDVLELDVEVPLAAHGHVLAAAQGALPERVTGALLTQAHLRHHEGLVGRVGGAVRQAQVPPVLLAGDLQPQPAKAAVQEGLQRAADGEGVPVAVAHLQRLLYQQGAVGVHVPAAVCCREEDLGGEAGVPARVLRGADVDPKRGLQDLDALAALLQELEGEAQAGLVTVHLSCGQVENNKD